MNFILYKNKIADWAKRSPYIYIAACLCVSAALLTVFIEITENTLFKNEMVVFDRFVIRLVQQYVSAGLTPAIVKITNLGSIKFYAIVCSLLFLYWTLRRRWLSALTLAVCIGGAGVLNFLLKNLFMRARPDIFRVITETGYSFPSGHAMGALCFYGIVAFFISRHIVGYKKRLTLYAVTAIFILLIGLSRIYLGVHYPSDVLAGYFAGSTWLFFCISLFLFLTRHKK